MKAGLFAAAGVAALFGATLAAVPAAAQSTLRFQRVEGAYRICVYGPADRRFDTGTLRDAELANRDPRVGLLTRRVGRGEPCPQRYRAPEPPVEVIPSMATLAGQQRGALGNVCIYRYLGQNYRRVVPPSTRCPYTPNLIGPAPSGSPTAGAAFPDRN